MKNLIAFLLVIISAICSIINYISYNDEKEKNFLLQKSMIEESKKESIANTELKKYLKQQKKEFDFFGITENDDTYEMKVQSLAILKSALGSRFDIENYEKSDILKELYDIVYRNITRNWKRTSDPEYYKEIMDALQSVRFLGDSMVSVMEAYNKLLNVEDRFHSFPGLNIKYQLNLIDESLLENVENIIFFNGCNIKNFKNSSEYVKTYYDIIDKIKSMNPNVKIFITSLCKATPEAVYDDLKKEFSHNFYNAPVFDKAIKDEFSYNEKAVYIDTSWIAEQKYYGKDGVHFKPEFYYAYIPYVLNFIKYIK